MRLETGQTGKRLAHEAEVEMADIQPACLPAEKWYDIVGYPGLPDHLFQLSSLGRIRYWTFTSEHQRQGTLVRRVHVARVMAQCICNGYRLVQANFSGKRKALPVHRILAHVHFGPCPAGLEVCHNNGVKTDCRIENLRYDTHSANTMDSVRAGTHPNNRGEDNGQSKLTEVSVHGIFKLRGHGMEQAAIGKIYRVDQSVVSRVLTRKRWSHVCLDAAPTGVRADIETARAATQATPTRRPLRRSRSRRIRSARTAVYV